MRDQILTRASRVGWPFLEVDGFRFVDEVDWVTVVRVVPPWVLKKIDLALAEREAQIGQQRILDEMRRQREQRYFDALDRRRYMNRRSR
jgi:hypothetical protein